MRQKTLLRSLFLILLFGTTTWLFAQTRTISGVITSADDGLPLPGVAIVIEGTAQGTITNIDGEFMLEAEPGVNLIISSVGFEQQVVSLGNQTQINVVMPVSVSSLDEVVVIGYGSLPVRDLTSAISTVRSEELDKTPTGQAMQALQGKVAGLQVVSSGAPGAAPTIRVRGIGSYPGQGSEGPLYVVDGMFFDDINFLNTADIASISILKDASAAAIYGVRAANGVVLIETKSGGIKQKSAITYDGYYGYQVAQNVLKMANAEQFTQMAIESGSPTDIAYIDNAMQRYGRSRINPNVPDVNTDWYNEIIRPAPIQNHSLNVTGGGESAAYSLGTNYFAQEGVLDMKNDYERFNLRSKLDYNVTNRLTVGASMIFSNSMRHNEDNSAWHTAYYAVPIMPMYDHMNAAAWPDKFASAQLLGYRDSKNPFPAMNYSESQNKTRILNAIFYAEMDLIPEALAIKTTYSNAFTSGTHRHVGLPYFISGGAQREESTINKSTFVGTVQTWDNILTHTLNANQHNLVTMLGTSYRDESAESIGAGGIGIRHDQRQAWYIGLADTKPEGSVFDWGARQYNLSYFGRVAYNFDNRYLLYGTMRADGSSKYQEKWGYFPTVGIGWVLSEEGFMQSTTAINFLKLRASWGRLGNDKVPASAGAATTSVVNTAIDDQKVPGTIAISTFSSLKWELTEESNVGITAEFFNNRLSTDIDYFIRDTKDAVIDVIIPSVGGLVKRNAGEIRNQGLEVILTWRDQLTNNLSYSISANMATLKNEVLYLYGQEYLNAGSAEFLQRTIVGEPLLAFFGYEVEGVYQNDAQIAADPIAVANGLVPGDFIYKDQNNDGVIDDADRVVLGSYIPSFNYGANLGLNYKNIDFSLNIVGQTGNKILNRKRGEIIWTADGNLDADLATNRWHGEGTSNKYPSSAGLRKGWNQKMSDYFVEDGSFFRIQNIQLGYTLKGTELLGNTIPQTRIFATAERPLTLFKYNGFNPEVADGIDRQTYPIPAIYTVGLNIKF